MFSWNFYNWLYTCENRGIRGLPFPSYIRSHFRAYVHDLWNSQL